MLLYSQLTYTQRSENILVTKRNLKTATKAEKSQSNERARCRSWTSKSFWKKTYLCWIHCRFLTNCSERYPSYQHIILGNHNDRSTKIPKHRPMWEHKDIFLNSVTQTSKDSSTCNVHHQRPEICLGFTGKRCRTSTPLARGQGINWPLVSWD